jgi:signal transduction histidine kinase
VTERWLRVSALTSIVVLLGFAAYSWQQHQAAREADSYAQKLQDWLALESAQSAELLRVRAGLVGHYDGIVRAVAARRRTLDSLRSVPAFVRERARAELMQALARAERERLLTEQQIELWKREHSVLRNSLRFLPHLAAELSQLSETEQPPAWNRSALAVVQDALLLQHWPEPSIDLRLSQGLERLSHERERAPEPARKPLASLLVHASLVRKHTPELNQLTHASVQPSAAERARHAYVVYADELHAEARREHVALWSGLLLSLCSAGLIAASIIVRLRHAASALQNTSAELARVVETLRVEQAKQRELTDLKTRFVAMTSHEFRTPLSVIMSSAELLEAYAERWQPHKKAEHFGRIRAAAAAMTRMLDAILMIGRSDAGALQPDAERVEIGSFCADVVAYMAQADPECQRIVYQGPGRATTVRADRGLLRQVLENLLSNAIKYSPGGSPVLCEVACQERELQLRVIDRGIGISQADQSRLFETFQRGSNVGRIGGSGLGLAVVGRAVQLHGGSVSVRSDVGAGSEFTVRIPCVEGGAWAEFS